jgi:hypothetical protein
MMDPGMEKETRRKEGSRAIGTWGYRIRNRTTECTATLETKALFLFFENVAYRSSFCITEFRNQEHRVKER